MAWIRNKKEIKKIRPIKNTWYDWLINYISEPIRKSIGGFKYKVFSLFDTNTPNSVGERKGTSKPKTQNIIYNIRNHFILKIILKKLKVK